MLADIPSSAYSAIAAGIGVPLVLGFFKASGFFSRNRKIHDTLSFEQLAQRYRAWEAFSVVLFLVFSAVGTYLFFRGLSTLALAAAPKLSVNTIYLTASPLFWLIPALFLGMITSALPLMLFLKLALGNRVYEFECYSDTKAGFNTNRAFAAIGIIIVGLCLLMIYAGLNYYWRFDKDGFAINRFTEFKEHRYSYSDIRELRHIAKFRAPNGDIKHKPYYEILTHDGKRWSSRWAPDNEAKSINRLFETIRQRSRLSFVRYDLAPEKTAPRDGK